MRKRIDWVDIAKFFGMFFVMLSHFEICPYYLRAFFTPFYLSIFFFCSGYTYRHQDSFRDFFVKKLNQLILPWFIYSNLNIVLSNIKSFKTHNNSFRVELFRNLLQIRYYDERLWFVPALFSAYLVFYWVIRFYRKKRDKKVALLLCIFLAFLRKLYKTYMDPALLPWNQINLPWHIDYIPTALLFMVLGYLFHDGWESEYERWIDRKKRVLIWGIYLFLVYFAFFTGIELPLVIDFIYDHSRHVFALLSLIALARIIPSNPYMLYIGRNTLVYFCIHNKAITLVEALFWTFLPALYQNLNGPFRSTVFCFLMTFLVSLILMIPCAFIVHYMPWSIGKTDLNRRR